MRLKNLILSGFITVSALSLASCGHEGPVIDNSWDSGDMTVKDEVILDGVTSQTINIKARTKPTLTCDAEWLRIGEVKNLSTGLYTAELTADANTTGETRRAEITVKADKETATVTVVQISGDFVEVTGLEPQGDLDPDGGALTLKYASTGKPALNLPEWITEGGSRALEEGSLTLSYLPNNTGKERTAMIVLATGSAVTNVTVRQPSRP